MWWPRKSHEFEGSERAVVIDNWPQPAVVAQPQVQADDTQLSVVYRTANERFVSVRFPLCHYFIFGAPNDEALGGHPLAKSGLQHYSVHEVHNSSLILELERRNSVHPRHDRKRFLEDLKHYIFTFQDSALECVVTEGQYWAPRIGTSESADEALRGNNDA